MRLDIMTDIETLGTNSDSTIIQLSAIAFNISTGSQTDQFNLIADIEKNEQPLKVTGGTIKWWLETDKELLHKLLSFGAHSSEDILREFHDWLCELEFQGYDLYLWGNGILFDNKMIQHQFEQLDLKYPIFYRNDRDVRTIVDLASHKLGISEKDLKERFNNDALVKHDAFDDVIYQINLVTGCYNILTGNEGSI
ncbi:3'-5' exonuclease [Jeotgalibacillus salarius]|uniref:3'-5' exoribonuclease n=1 Tax=Jeotgalibacillus salarius TaxID=546023 RepID=A0A4Y8LPJ4_9BACL|nr:3'-5' exonuclease [Jeotgalibacillus salarius]TFE02867.1 3'-5' exoribonuclease [Jeotgalibacillus salarius]